MLYYLDCNSVNPLRKVNPNLISCSSLIIMITNQQYHSFRHHLNSFEIEFNSTLDFQRLILLFHSGAIGCPQSGIYWELLFRLLKCAYQFDT